MTDPEVDLSQLSPADRDTFIDAMIDSRPNRGVNLAVAQEVADEVDEAVFAASARSYLQALIDELRLTRRSVQRQADHLDEIMAIHHVESTPCERWCDEICQVADDLRAL